MGRSPRIKETDPRRRYFKLHLCLTQKENSLFKKKNEIYDYSISWK